jgi:hypothetical protein
MAKLNNHDLSAAAPGFNGIFFGNQRGGENPLRRLAPLIPDEPFPTNLKTLWIEASGAANRLPSLLDQCVSSPARNTFPRQVRGAITSTGGGNVSAGLVSLLHAEAADFWAQELLRDSAANPFYGYVTRAVAKPPLLEPILLKTQWQKNVFHIKFRASMGGQLGPLLRVLLQFLTGAWFLDSAENELTKTRDQPDAEALLSISSDRDADAVQASIYNPDSDLSVVAAAHAIEFLSIVRYHPEDTIGHRLR